MEWNGMRWNGMGMDMDMEGHGSAALYHRFESAGALYQSAGALYHRFESAKLFICSN